MATHTKHDPERMLPLKPAWFHILLALQDQAQHGYAIRDAAKEQSRGAVKLWPATLYGSIRELSEAGAIVALEGEADPDDDQRRRYYRLTSFGRELLKAEADRLQDLVNAVRVPGTVGGA